MASISEGYENRRRLVRRVIAKYQPNPSDIDEIEQEVFLRCHSISCEEELREPEHLMKRIAKNLAINRARRRSFDNISIEEIGGCDVFIDEQAPSQERQVGDAQRLRIVEQAIMELSSECREALLLRRIDGLRYKEIAQRLGISVSAVEKRIANALVDIQLYLRRNGYSPDDFAQPSRLAAQPKDSSRRMHGQEPA